MTHDTSSRITTLAHLGLLRISGEGAKKLLQGQLTCDLEEITPTTSRIGAYCQPQGRMLSLFRLFLFRDDYYLQMPADILAETMTTLKKYAVFFKVSLSDASATLSRISISGKEAEAQLKGILGDLPQTPDSVISFTDFILLKLPSEVPHYELVGDQTALESLQDQLRDSTQSASFEYWKLLNISAGIPDIHAETAGKLLPHDINLPRLNGVSFNKGCYTGQEIIARMHYRGQLKKQMYRGRVTTQHKPVSGADIFHDKVCGTLVDSAQEQDQTYQILLIADKTAIESGQLYLDPAKLEPIELLTLPY